LLKQSVGAIIRLGTKSDQREYRGRTEMSREWRTQGVIDIIPIKLDEATKQHIRDQLHAGFQIELENPEAFFSALNWACTSFKSDQRLTKASQPSKVRANLQAAIDAALELDNKLTSLDFNSWSLIFSSSEHSVGSLLQCTSTILNALHGASHLAEEYPKKGRLYEHYRLRLAMDVASAIETHLGRKPTTAKGGLFESILSIVLGFLTGKEVRSVHELSREALRTKRRNFDKVTISVSQECADYLRGLTAGSCPYLPPEDD
jgi:hypothetical protein